MKKEITKKQRGKELKYEIILGIIILFSFLISIYFYPTMPEKMASHWDMKGHVNGYMPKLLGTFLIPILLIILDLIFFVIPKIDPLKENIKKFEEYYYNFIVLLFLFLFVIQAQILLWNSGTKISFNLVMPVIIGILLYYTGILLENAKRNWFIGIRTPWTLNSEKVWNRTHKLGGKLFKISGVICLIGLLFQEYVIYFMVIPIILSVIYLFVYSYFEYKKEEGMERNKKGKENKGRK